MADQHPLDACSTCKRSSSRRRHVEKGARESGWSTCRFACGCQGERGVSSPKRWMKKRRAGACVAQVKGRSAWRSLDGNHQQREVDRMAMVRGRHRQQRFAFATGWTYRSTNQLLGHVAMVLRLLRDWCGLSHPRSIGFERERSSGSNHWESDRVASITGKDVRWGCFPILSPLPNLPRGCIRGEWTGAVHEHLRKIQPSQTHKTRG